MLKRIESLLNEVISETVNNYFELESFRLKYLSKKGKIADLFSEFRTIPSEDKKIIGQKLNILKNSAQEKYNILRKELCEVAEDKSTEDLSKPSFPIRWVADIQYLLSAGKSLIFLQELALLFQKVLK